LIDCQAKVASTTPIYMSLAFRLHFIEIPFPLSCLGLQFRQGQFKKLTVVCLYLN